MEFPADVLEATSHGELERSAHSYMNQLLYTDPDHAHYVTLPSGKKVQISLSSVGFVPLYGANLQHKVLALFTPQDQLTAVALFLANQWYSVEDVLKTANSRREGLVKVRSVGERIVLYALNRIVYRTKEMGSGEMPFLCHSENDYAKILWKNGQAVGFYSVKPKGSVYNNSLRQCYVLPVMDSIYVRKAFRGKGYGLQMLEDFVDSFNEDELGLKYPLSPAMTNVCRHYLDRYPADVDLLWEVEGIGGPYQRTRVAYKLTTRPLKDTHKGGRGEDKGQNGDTVEDEVEESEETCLNLTDEVIVVNKHHKVTEEMDTPISTRTRSSEHRRNKRVREEEEAQGVDTQPQKINRMEMAEEEKRLFLPADGAVVESVPETPTETPAVEVNGKQAEDKEEVKEGADEENESAVQNGTGDEEEEEMEVEEEEHEVPVQKTTADTPEEPVSEQQEAAPVVEDDQEMEADPSAAGASEEEMVAENEQKEVDTQVAPAAKKQEVAPAVDEEQDVAPAAEKKQDVAPAAEKKQDVAPAAEKKQDVAPAAEKKQDVAPAAEKKQDVAPAAEKKQDVAPAAEKEQGVAPAPEEKQEVASASEEKQEVASASEEEVVAPISEEEQERLILVEEEEDGTPASEDEKVVAPVAEEETKGAPATKEKQGEAAVAAEHQEGASSVEEEQDAIPESKEEQEVVPETKKNEVAGKEEMEVAPEDEDNEVAPEVEKKEVHPPAQETSFSLALYAEEEQEEAMNVVNDTEVPDTSEQSSKEEERQPPGGKERSALMVEEVEAARKEDEMDEEGEEKNVNEASDFSRVLRGARTKAVPSTSKRASRRRSKVTPEDDEEEQAEANVVEEDKGMSTDEEKVTTEEEEAEHSSAEEEQVQDAPVIDKRVLRGKTKVIQSKQRTRSKRRGKM